MTRAAGNVFAQLFLLGLFTAAPFLAARLDARVGPALLSPVPASWVVVAFFAGNAVVLTAWALTKRGPRLTTNQRCLLILLQQAGENGAYYGRARKVVGLNPAKFNLLVHELSSRKLIYDNSLDTRVWEDGDPPERRHLTIRGDGKTLLARLSPRSLDDDGPLPDGVEVRRRKKPADWTAY